MTPEKGIILVTGSNGGIGNAVMKRFAGRFEHVVGFDRKAPDPAPPGCTAVAVDITSDDSVRDGMRLIRDHHGTHIVAVIHLAAYYDFLGEKSEKYDQITVLGTGRLIKNLHELGFKVEQFIFSSTMLVHRPADPGQFITEDWPIEPTWAYPESKVLTEALIHAERGEIPAVMLRIAGVYADRCHSIPLAHQIQRIDEKQFTSRLYSGSTAHGQSFVHMDDLVDSIVATVERRAALPREIAILIGEPEPLTYDEVQHTLSRLIHGDDWETLEVPAPLTPFAKVGAWVMEKLPGRDPFIRPWMIDRANDHYALDITRAKTLLGWSPKRTLRETLPKMVAALKADRTAWYKENDLEQAGTGGAAKVDKGDGATESEKPPHDHAKPAPAEHSSHAATHAAPPMDMAAHGAAMAHPAVVWPHFANMILAVWLITNTFALEYRSTSLQVSDVISGALVLGFAILSLAAPPRLKFWSPWANSFVGIWLLFAPLVFWAPTSAIYSNDTLVGMLVIAFAILAPGMPMKAGMVMTPGPDVPRGWSYNPSSWPQRAPIIALALVGFFLSRQMTAFQLHHIKSFGDPFFGSGTQRVLTSDVSRAFPIPDAGLGALAYSLEFLMGFMGDKQRWRTMPWMVMFFGILVVPLGIVSITLIILQPIAVGAWCTPCLLAATAMLVMISLTLDEVVATLQFLVHARRERLPMWKTFWMGGALREVAEVPRPIRPSVVRPSAMVWGVKLPWNLVLTTALGLWLMFAPSTFSSLGLAAHSDHLIGALIVTASVIALADVGRTARYINVVFGAWVIASPWLLDGAGAGARWSDVIVGALVLLLSFRRGPIGDRYGSYERFIR
jgi:nucleoside-diphosphate-sugar epimerase/uncharacterized membrane protein